MKQEHIDAGRCCKAMKCPLALALSEKLGVPMAVGLYDAGGETENGIEIFIKLTPEMRDVIDVVDGGKADTLTPTTFNISIERYKDV